MKTSQLPSSKDKKPIDVEKFIKLANKVRKIFEEEEKNIKQQTSVGYDRNIDSRLILSDR